MAVSNWFVFAKKFLPGRVCCLSALILLKLPGQLDNRLGNPPNTCDGAGRRRGDEKQRSRDVREQRKGARTGVDSAAIHRACSVY